MLLMGVRVSGTGPSPKQRRTMSYGDEASVRFWEKPSSLTCDATAGLLSKKVHFASWPLVRGCIAVEGWESAIVSNKIKNKVILYPHTCDYRR